MQDLRFALRRLRRAPAFTLTSILVLTLAAGASAAVFGSPLAIARVVRAT
jgi:hypothetical protein